MPGTALYWIVPCSGVVLGQGFYLTRYKFGEMIMTDLTESTRRSMVAEINTNPGPREALEAEHGQVWDTTELTKEFQVLSFLAPFCRPIEEVSAKPNGRGF